LILVGNSETTAAAVNPLAGDLTTIKVADSRASDERREVQGLIVAPGLGITPHRDNDGEKPNRYCLTHIPSGLAAGTNHCGMHVQQAAKTAIAADIDWTADKTTVVAEIKAAEGLIDALFHLRCTDWCEGDGPQPPSYSVRCSTCDWQYDPDEDDYDEGPLTFEDARRMGRDHECEPFIEISVPDTSDWHPDWRFDKAGQLIPITAVCANCNEAIANIGRRHGPYWQHTATKFVMCADGHSYAEPKNTTEQGS
jgi:hypothetical protein